MNWTERCWAQVDLQALRRNYRRLRGLLSPRQKYLAVVKANAYGHGAVPVALALEEEGADWFGAATLEEGEELRRGGVTRPILLFGYTPPTAARRLAAGKLTQGVFSGEYAAALGAEALRAGVQVDFHLMVDSGMGRLGLRPGEPNSLRQAAEILANPALRCTGTFTHFAVADELGEASSAFTGEQFARFEGFLDRMRKAGMDPGLCHCANSAAAILTPGMRLGMCRFGIVQYGLSPSEEVGWTELEPVMSLRATVAMVKEARAGDTFSYGRLYTAPGPRTIATVAIGYADGYPRCGWQGGRVILKGQYAPIAGRVCMDQTLVDVSAIEGVRAGDTAVVIGKSGEEEISACDLAERAGTISNEILSRLGGRLERIVV